MNLSLAATMPLGGPCPTMRFFVPTGAFFEAMKAFRGMDIVDVGAGRGHVTIALVLGAIAFMWLRPSDLAGDRKTVAARTPASA